VVIPWYLRPTLNCDRRDQAALGFHSNVILYSSEIFALSSFLLIEMQGCIPGIFWPKTDRPKICESARHLWTALKTLLTMVSLPHIARLPQAPPSSKPHLFPYPLDSEISVEFSKFF
jgi:hypothetical protein